MPPDRPTSIRYLVLVLLGLAAATAYLTRHCLAVANTTIQEELAINNEQFGILYAAFSLGYLLFQIPGGWVGQHLGTRKTMPLLAVAWSACTAITASLYTLGSLTAARFAFGLAQAGLIPNQAEVVQDWFPVRFRATASSVITTSMSVGSAGTMAMTAALLIDYPWRTVLWWYSLVGVAWAIAFYLLFRTRPEQHPWTNRAEQELIRDDADGRGQPQSGSNTAAGGWLLMLGSVSIWALAIGLFFKAAGYNFFVTFFPAFLEYAYGIKKVEAGMLTTWPLVGVAVGSLTAGFITDWIYRRTRSKRISRCGVSIVALTLTALFLLLSLTTRTAGGLATVIAMGAFFSAMSLPCTWAAVIDVGGNRSGVVMGMVNCIGNLAGVILTPLIGRLIDHIRATDGNWNHVIYLLAGFYLTSGACWLFVQPDRPLETPKRPLG